jgi:hypothetical protein
MEGGGGVTLIGNFHFKGPWSFLPTYILYIRGRGGGGGRERPIKAVLF